MPQNPTRQVHALLGTVELGDSPANKKHLTTTRLCNTISFMGVCKQNMSGAEMQNQEILNSK
jgi:hypothetical protein